MFAFLESWVAQNESTMYRKNVSLNDYRSFLYPDQFALVVGIKRNLFYVTKLFFIPHILLEKVSMDKIIK